MRARALTALLACLGLSGCGTNTRLHASADSAAAAIAAPQQCDPAPGQGRLGVCTTQPSNRLLRVARANSPQLVTAGRRLFPDVSHYQGFPDWASKVHAGLSAVVVKAYEVNYCPSVNCADVSFNSSWRALAALHVWHAAYLFVRAGDCVQAADSYLSIVANAGGWDQFAGPPILDVEVPGANAGGQVPCISARIHQRTGVSTVVVYTAPGTWPGGPDAAAPLWIATYGSSFGCIWTCHPVAWQYTDGIYGPGPHCVYGLCGDVSIDYGLTAILAHPVQRTWLTAGDQGSAVFVLIHRLRVAGWIGHDGAFYSHHVALVIKAFQVKHGLKPSSGIAGQRTQALVKTIAEFDKAHHIHDIGRPL